MRDLSKNKNIEFIEEVKVPLFGGISLKKYRCRTAGRIWFVTVSTEYDKRYDCWCEHICFSDINKKAKYIPSWEQIVAIKREFFEPYEECIQFIPREDEYVNINKNAMHIFRMIRQEEGTK